MRAYGLGRALRRLKPKVRQRYLLPERLAAWGAGLGLEVHAAPRDGLHAWVEARLGKPSLLVVDVFPRGVLGELRTELPSVLVTRWTRPSFFRHPPVAEALGRYRTILWSEPPQRPEGERVEPILAVEAEDLLEAQPGPRRWLALSSGPPEERRGFLKLVRRVSAGLGIACQLDGPFPAGRTLRQFELVICAAGYQTYYEVVQAGVPAILCPQPRLYDDQLLRAQGQLGPTPAAWALASTPGELEGLLREWKPRAPGPPRPLRGARQGAERLAQLLE